MNNPVLVLYLDGEVYVFGDLDEMVDWLSERCGCGYRLPVGQFFPMDKGDARWLYPRAFGDWEE